MSWKPELILLDLDGTLVDSFPAITRALNEALAARGLPAVDLDWVRGHVGRGARALVADALPGPRDDAAVDDLLGGFRERYQRVFLEATPPLPGVPETLETLAASAPLALVTNKPDDWAIQLIEHLGWSRLFRSIQGPHEAGARKPEPAMVHRALDAVGARPGNALLVGDMEVDVETARRAGVPMIAVASGARSAAQLESAGAPAVLVGLADLPSWLNAAAGPGAARVEWESLQGDDR
ncbi:MAG: HAD-IA family hydrolase [Acidobacteria bacterium]|nr:HAD-IA family hydrolase [Acidobacteriota bacterium]